MVMDHLQGSAVVISDTRMQIAQAPGKTTPSMMLTVEILERNERQGGVGVQWGGGGGGECIGKLQERGSEKKRGEGPRWLRDPAIGSATLSRCIRILHFDAQFCINER